jgi:hypothetical protein
MKNIYIPLLLALLAFTSCKRILVSIITDKSIDSKIRVLENKETGKTLCFLPMIHIGKPEYYESVRKVIDSLRQEGYIVYYESVGYDEEPDSLTRDTIDRKVRKLIGFYFGSSYKDSSNNSLPKAITNSNYEMQDYKKIGVLETDKKVDLSIDSLIRRYEQDIKPIKLLPCDFETDLLEKYKCKDKEKYSDHSFYHTFRNDHITSEVLKSEDKKIMMVYGKSHWFSFWPRFNKNGYELVYGKI